MAISRSRSLIALAAAILLAFSLNGGAVTVVCGTFALVFFSKSPRRMFLLLTLLALASCVFYTVLGVPASANRAADVVYILLPISLLVRIWWE